MTEKLLKATFSPNTTRNGWDLEKNFTDKCTHYCTVLDLGLIITESLGPNVAKLSNAELHE